jgi:hypothetical protein
MSGFIVRNLVELTSAVLCFFFGLIMALEALNEARSLRQSLVPRGNCDCLDHDVPERRAGRT